MLGAFEITIRAPDLIVTFQAARRKKQTEGQKYRDRHGRRRLSGSGTVMGPAEPVPVFPAVPVPAFRDRFFSTGRRRSEKMGQQFKGGGRGCNQRRKKSINPGRWTGWRSFPRWNGSFFLNHAALSPLPARAARALLTYAEEAAQLGGAAWPRWHGRFKQARPRAAAFLGAEPDERPTSRARRTG